MYDQHEPAHTKRQPPSRNPHPRIMTRRGFGQKSRLTCGTPFAYFLLGYERRNVMKNPQNHLERAGAAGKALIVWLASGSLGLAVIAYLLFSGMGC
jgi:hypothetical protein